MKKIAIDINADVGEIVRNETILMPYLSSCNIACGGNAGNKKVMGEVITLAKNNNVKIGAHPSFPDMVNFGRKVLDISNLDLFNTVKRQILNLKQIADQKKIDLHHVKPHGALYNLAAKDEEKAGVIIDVLKSIEIPLTIYAPHGSVMAKLAEKQGIKVKYEAFMDRSYNTDLSLVSRGEPNALLINSGEVFDHLRRMIRSQEVRTINGEIIPIKADTYCIHSDNGNVVNILNHITLKFKEENIAIL